jgi:type IV pilus assembly protein PilV
MKPKNKNKPASKTLRAHAGFMLLEALIGILLFTIGALGIIGLQAASIKVSAGSEYRSIAALQASDIISRMWVSDRTFATLQSNFSSSNSGAVYQDWLNTVNASGLPGVADSPPTISFTTVVGGGSSPVSSSLATVTIYWHAPGETELHNYVAVAQLK